MRGRVCQRTLCGPSAQASGHRMAECRGSRCRRRKTRVQTYPALAGGGFERRLEYTVPVKRNRLGPSEARCEEVQHCRRRGADGFWVSVVARTPEVPLCAAPVGQRIPTLTLPSQG